MDLTDILIIFMLIVLLISIQYTKIKNNNNNNIYERGSGYEVMNHNSIFHGNLLYIILIIILIICMSVQTN